MVGEACLPSNAYYPRTPDYTLYSGVHVCWSEHSDSSFVYGFMSLDYGLGTMTATTSIKIFPFRFEPFLKGSDAQESKQEVTTELTLRKWRKIYRVHLSSSNGASYI